MLTNKPNLCCNFTNFATGISDCHNFISFQLRGITPRVSREYLQYRSYRSFDKQTCMEDLGHTPFHVAHIFDDVNDVYWASEGLLQEVFDQHVPIKQAKRRKQSAPFMNRVLRKAIYKKRMLLNKYIRCRNKRNWQNYRRQRNLVTKLRKKSIRNYFFERCSGGPKSKDFWPTIKPFLSWKSTKSSTNINLSHENKIVTDPKQVSEIFNDYYIHVADDIGTNGSHDYEYHPSILEISNHLGETKNFEFTKVNHEFVSKQIDKINTRKATGPDGISSKFLKLVKPAVVMPLTNLINLSLTTGCFPDKLKEAQVTPIFKKDDPMERENYRPVSVLSVVSKLFERAMNEQMGQYFSDILHPFVSAFRQGYGCQTTLLRAVEDWKRALDEKKHVVAVLTDLSKAFDCLPHKLLLCKLKAYGLSNTAIKLLESYLANRKQCVKVANTTSSWQSILKGVPQGSIMGPLLFNIFVNDIFFFIKEGMLYNYADDNTLSYSHTCLQTVKNVLEKGCRELIAWFDYNLMRANPDKFQGILFGQKSNQDFALNIGQYNITCEEEVKLLGVTIDFKLKFDTHISDICIKASRQLNVLKRIGHYLNRSCKLLIYHSFILSNFGYCPLAWHFCNQGSVQKMERIQERALRFIYDDYISPYQNLLSKSNFPSLHIRRLKTMALEAYKILHKQSPVYLHDLLVRNENKITFRYNNQVIIPRVRTTTHGLNSFRYSAAKLWNELPDNFRTTSSFSQFKRLIENWNGFNCKCRACK